jgi:pilus assembly protein Flp/PilA
MTKFYCWLQALVKSEEGATAVEYGVMVALIIAICIAAVQTIGADVLTAFNKVAGALPNS